jgi:hypothetical protein
MACDPPRDHHDGRSTSLDRWPEHIHRADVCPSDAAAENLLDSQQVKLSIQQDHPYLLMIEQLHLGHHQRGNTVRIWGMVQNLGELD